MAVRGGDLVRHDELDTRIKRRRDLGLAAQARVLQHQDAPFRLLRRNQLARLEHGRADGGKAPGRRHAGALGLRRDQRAHHGPQGRHVLFVDALVEGFAFCRFDGDLLHSCLPWLAARVRRWVARGHFRRGRHRGLRAHASSRAYSQKALRRRGARSRWKWSRWASFASGPNTVPNNPQAPLCNRRRKAPSGLICASSRASASCAVPLASAAASALRPSRCNGGPRETSSAPWASLRWSPPGREMALGVRTGAFAGSLLAASSLSLPRTAVRAASFWSRKVGPQ